jgi:hypothetical protein
MLCLFNDALSRSPATVPQSRMMCNTLERICLENDVSLMCSISYTIGKLDVASKKVRGKSQTGIFRCRARSEIVTSWLLFRKVAACDDLPSVDFITIGASYKTISRWHELYTTHYYFKWLRLRQYLTKYKETKFPIYCSVIPVHGLRVPNWAFTWNGGLFNLKIITKSFTTRT